MSQNNTSSFEREFPYIGQVDAQGVQYRFPFRTILDAVTQAMTYAGYEAEKTDKGVLWSVWERGTGYTKLENAVKYGVVSGKKK